MFLVSIKDFILDILFPIYCLNCGREGEWLCQDCHALLEVTQYRFCLCKRPVQLFRRGKCKKCWSKNLDGLYFALSYEQPRVRRLIQLFKYKPYLKELGKSLADLIISHFRLLERQPDFSCFVLLPAPLYKKKLKKRGYNQAKLLAKELAESLDISLSLSCLIKTRPTPAQVDLPENQRKANIKGAFSVKNSSKIKNQKILLVDDVYTTGSTMEECARVLKESGAKEVWGVALARG